MYIDIFPLIYRFEAVKITCQNIDYHFIKQQEMGARVTGANAMD